MPRTRYVIAAAIALLAWGHRPDAAAALPEAPPERHGFDPARLARIDGIVASAVERKAVPGAVVLVGRHGFLVYARAFGLRSVAPGSEPMTRDTAFDLASLTKPLATATSIMALVERGQLRLDDRLGRLLPAFDGQGKGAITVEQLLRHRAGLIADNPIADYAQGPAEAWARLGTLSLTYPAGSSYVYSDVGFLTLGKVVEAVSGEPLDVFARENVFGPLGMADTHFRPVGGPAPAVPVERVAPTEPGRPAEAPLRGVVHDPRARALGGVAGHAGLFGTADDLAVYAQTLLNGGLGPNGRRVLGPLTVRAMTDPGDTPPGERRGLGWDMGTPHSSPRGELFNGGFGHTGFTGTSLWVDPESQTFVIVLTSRLHPDGKAPSPTALRSAVATVVASALTDVSPVSTRPANSTQPPRAASPQDRPIACGIDVLARDGFAPLRGKRVALVTNQTGRTRDGRATVDALFHAPGVTLVALFSPEHGIRGLLDAKVPDGRDEATGLPVISLYGKTRKPSPERLKDADALVYDIQDIGTRFYTYISTLGLTLEAARERGIPLYVLDRPNPIGGDAVGGPVRDDGFESFIAHHALPVRHGMTVGELARLFNAERGVGADLRVVPCEGWRRADRFDRTGLTWVNPSPNMRGLTQALLYPGVGLLEASNLATGRGTDTPFERVGAPWIDPPAFAAALNAQGLPGVRFVPVRFTPRERQYAGVDCGGVNILIVDYAAFEPIALGLGLAHALRTLYRDAWQPEGFLKMLADRASYQAVLDGQAPRAVEALWRAELAEFRRTRQKYLLYP